MPETVVTWLWKPKPGYRSQFGADQVNTLHRMVKRHYPQPHRFVCVTHEYRGMDREVEVMKPWDDFADVQNPNGPHNPSCYRRLRAFHAEIATSFGARFVSLDLDCVVTRDLTPVWDRAEDFVIWGDTNPRTHYNGSMFLMSAGARPKVWTDFNPATSPRESYASGCFGSDQGWISKCLGPGQAKWTRADGVYSFRNELMKRPALPADARIVFFHGPGDPWQPHMQHRYPWIKRHYC
jgi:hypothetical protein